MDLTDEQKAIVEHQTDCRVNAVAGSGKTSTLVSYAKARPKARILYLAFNRSVKEEAQRRFAAEGIFNTTIETAHSLAYKLIGVRNNFTLQKANLGVADIIDLCSIPETRDGSHLMLASHIRTFLGYYCNMDIVKMDELDYPATLSDPAKQKFAVDNYGSIVDNAKEILTRMYRKELPVSHDAYLKFFQLRNPTLDYSHILYDEGQDASPVMLEVFNRQKAVKVIVGDTAQSIYGFRHAVDSLNAVGYPRRDLTLSFRFDHRVARAARNVLNLKKLWGEDCPVVIKGVGGEPKPVGMTPRAVIARTNLALLGHAFSAMSNGCRRLCMEGGLQSYTFMGEGANLYDLLFLYLGQTGRVRNPYIASFKRWDLLTAFLKTADERDLALGAKIVEEYGQSLFSLLNLLKEYQVPREEAELIYATTHRAKGQEYTLVEVLEDFISRVSIMETLEKARNLELMSQGIPGGVKKGKPVNLKELGEEVNALYVAVTRTKSTFIGNANLIETSAA